MKLTITLTEEDAACLWANHHEEPIEEIAARVLEQESKAYRQAFPRNVNNAIEQFRIAHPARAKQTGS